MIKKNLLDFISPAYRSKINMDKWNIGKDFPLKIELHPVQACNLSCSFCINRQYRNEIQNFEEISFNSYKSFLDKAYALGSQILAISGGGEPLLSEVSQDVLIYAKTTGFFTKLSSNGIKLINNKILEHCDHIRISLNALDFNDYYSITNSKLYNTVVENIDRIIDYKSKSKPSLYIEVSFQLINSNYNKIISNLDDFIRFRNIDKILLEIPYEISLSTISEVLEISKNSRFNALLEKYSSQVTFHGFITKFNTNLDNCFVPYFKVTINNDGNILPCCQLSDRGGKQFPEYILGNIVSQSADEIWENAEKIIKTIKPLKCPQCIPTEHDINKQYIKHYTQHTI